MIRDRINALLHREFVNAELLQVRGEPLGTGWSRGFDDRGVVPIPLTLLRDGHVAARLIDCLSEDGWLICGASEGIGRATAIELAQLGAQFLAADLQGRRFHETIHKHDLVRYLEVGQTTAAYPFLQFNRAWLVILGNDEGAAAFAQKPVRQGDHRGIEHRHVPIEIVAVSPADPTLRESVHLLVLQRRSRFRAPAELHEINPRLVIVRISGWGQDGRYRHKPGFGTLIEAASGFASMNGFPDRPPLLPPIALADHPEPAGGPIRATEPGLYLVTLTGHGTASRWPSAIGRR